ncbi:Protein angel 2 [Mortierella sp. 14UC]|nr:Protein angel 2 [Mortierella sp. 14UC]
MFRLLRRNWSSPPHNHYDTFTVMTYNLLSNTLAMKNQHLYRHCAQGTIKWRDRSKRLIQELRSQLLDIYCLQELDKEHYIDLLQPTFREWGYSGVYKKRNGLKTDGCAIFFRNSTRYSDIDYKEHDKSNGHYSGHNGNHGNEHDSDYNHSFNRNRNDSSDSAFRAGVECFEPAVTYQEIKERMGRARWILH